MNYWSQKYMQDWSLTIYAEIVNVLIPSILNKSLSKRIRSEASHQLSKKETKHIAKMAMNWWMRICTFIQNEALGIVENAKILSLKCAEMDLLKRQFADVEILHMQKVNVSLAICTNIGN